MAPHPNSASGSGSAREEVSVKFPSKDPKKNDEKKDEDLSEEDLALKQQLELYVERVQDPDPGLQKVALESMRGAVRHSSRRETSWLRCANLAESTARRLMR
ncbi:26S proteasome regulatory subunit S2 1A [Actinidia rufa]|uniref:26S proteasome regulatory subunit S2 1A n=1 Tax=Actinidia rufa TaxID=165716 RepID=A0A7J0DBP1_9ERIC|nr:26S proteasome regulatory subunit S2 1A [Actinidia rufa]